MCIIAHDLEPISASCFDFTNCHMYLLLDVATTSLGRQDRFFCFFYKDSELSYLPSITML